MTALKAWIRALEYTRSAVEETLPGLIDQLAYTYLDEPALIDENETLSYRALAQRTNRYARWALAQGLGQADVVGLLMPNRADYVAIWLGLARIGCTVALLNINLRGSALTHCLNIAKSDTVIVADVFRDLVPPGRRLWNWDTIRSGMESYSPEPLDDVACPLPRHRALLIYTSGTTGLPKATNITHRRVTEWSFWFAGMMDTVTQDRLYNCLPMYHSVGGVVAIGSMLVKGGSVVIRERFSASRFWDDVRDTGSTIFQYIGELCRYLTLNGPHLRERDHSLRLACGNGLQGDVWHDFEDRFAIPRILEFYAATEGNLSLYNCEGKPGAIGRIPPFLARHFRVAIIRCEADTGVPLRSAEGLCIVCENNEPGEAISQMQDDRQFDGYTDRDASERKVLHDVFAEGDSWFRSGDLMRMDGRGYFYFVDRLGDTYRWKGENVSTTEVASVLRGVAGVIGAVVFGISVPGSDGRAGMAAIQVDERFSFAALSDHLRENLPHYAHPMFVRLCSSLGMTGTFKLTKVDLMREGLSIKSDRIWRRDAKTGEFHEILE